MDLELLADDWQEFEHLQEHLNETGAWEINPGSGPTPLEVHLMSQAIVTQNDDTGNWIVKYSGKVVEFGATSKEADRARWLGVIVNNPKISALAQKLADKFEVKGLESRARRAAVLAAEGRVTIVQDPRKDDDPPIITRGNVRALGSSKTYWIQLNDDGYRCNCMDWKGVYAPVVNLSHGQQKLCKHLIAYLIVEHFDRPAVSAGVGKRSGGTVNQPRVPAEVQDPPIYLSGDNVEEDDLEVFRSYVNSMQTRPHDREKLYGWLFRG